MALRTEIASRRDGGAHVAVAVHVVRDAERNGLGLGNAIAVVAEQAAVGVLVQLVAVDLVRDGRRLHGVGALAPQVLVLHVRQHRRTRLLGQRRPSAHGVDQTGLLCGGGGREQPAGQQHDAQACFVHGSSYALTIFTAHFLKSVCSEIGSVASSVTLLMSWLASNQGTNTRPLGMRLRPRVSTRERISPRREMMRTSLPRRTPSARASSGCMYTTALGKAR